MGAGGCKPVRLRSASKKFTLLPLFVALLFQLSALNAIELNNEKVNFEIKYDTALTESTTKFLIFKGHSINLISTKL